MLPNFSTEDPELTYCGKTGIDSQSNIRSVHTNDVLCFVSPCDSFDVKTSSIPVTVTTRGVIFLYYIDSEGNKTIIPIPNVYPMPMTDYPIIPFSYLNGSDGWKLFLSEMTLKYRNNITFDMHFITSFILHTYHTYARCRCAFV